MLAKVDVDEYQIQQIDTSIAAADNAIEAHGGRMHESESMQMHARSNDIGEIIEYNANEVNRASIFAVRLQ